MTERSQGKQGFEARVVVLDADGEANSVAVLDTSTLDMELLNNDLHGLHLAAGWVPTDK